MSAKSRKQEIRKEQKDWERIDEAVVTSERFLEKYQKQILIAVAAVVLVVCGFLAYRTFYLQPKNNEAQVAMFKGEQYFMAQQDSLALYGDGNGYIGFEAIINQYGSTKAANIAKMYAGISYSRLGNYEQAISYLNNFKGGDEILTYTAKGALGDCLVNTGKLDEGVKHFMDAAKGLDDRHLAPIYYKKAALTYRELKNYDKVIELFTKLKNEYIGTTEANDAEKYIEEAQILKSK